MLKKVLLVAAGGFALGCTSAHAQDLALNRPATASSTERGSPDFRPTNANDGNSSSRWSSEFVDNQWWQVDLGSNQSINRVELNWEVAYARRYRIRTRTARGNSWSTVARVETSSAGLKTHTFGTTRARYVRIQGDQRATPWGISLWEVRVCNISCSGTAPPFPPDADGDGVPDSSDQCPNEAGPAHNNGCPVPPPANDTDGDRVPDSEDQCPNQPGPASNKGCPVATNEPPAIAGQGYTKAFEDNFDTYNSPGIWSTDIWWQNNDPADAKFVQNGILNLVSRRSQGFPFIDTTTHNTRFWQQGYMECRLRWTGVPGSFPACWMISEGWADNGNCNAPAAELDIFEGQGVEPNKFYGTLHRHSASHVANCGLVDQRNAHVTLPFRFADNWHTYATKWTADQVCWYVDDQQAGSCVPTYDTTDDSPMFISLMQGTGGWAAGSVVPPTVNEVRSEYDWVRVWQR